MTETIFILFFVIYLFAGTIKGMLGIGYPTTVVTLCATFTDARLAVAYLVIPMCLINVWQIYRSGNYAVVIKDNWRLLLTMMAFIAIFSLVAAKVPIKTLTIVLGVIIFSFSLVSLWKSPPALPDKFNKLAQVITGAVSGTIGGLAGVWAPPIIMYLTARRVDREVFVQTTGVILFVGSCVLFLGYWNTGIIHKDIAAPSLSLLIPSVIGFTVGERIRTHLRGDVFYKCVLILFLVLGLNFIRRGFVM